MSATPNQELLQYPRGQVSMDSGPLYQITDYDHELVNGAKLQSTLRSDPAGFTLGKRAVSGGFNCMIDEGGEERDWDSMVLNGTVTSFRLKFPGGDTKTISAILTSVGAKITLEDGVGRAMKFIGKLITT